MSSSNNPFRRHDPPAPTEPSFEPPSNPGFEPPGNPGFEMPSETDHEIIPPANADITSAPFLTAPVNYPRIGQEEQSDSTYDQASNYGQSENYSDDTAPSRLPLILAACAAGLAFITFLIAVGLVPVATVGEKQIKSDAVVGEKVKPKSLSASAFAGPLPAGPQGTQGEQGDVGPKGPRGQTGARGASGAAGLVSTSEQTAASSAPSQTVRVSCPAGKKVTGGGAEISGGGKLVFLTSSLPSSDGWQAAAAESGSFSGRWALKATVVCANK